MTRRQAIANALRQGPLTVRAVARRFGIPIRVAVEDLEHLRRSVRGRERFEVIDAECSACGYVFRDRRRLQAPSRCPRCRRESVVAPEFFIGGPDAGERGGAP